MSIKDVARLAGVSSSTVSRVVNSGLSSAASKETQDKIWEAVRQIGYSPNPHARNLKKPAGTNAVITEIDCVYARKVGPFLDPFFATLMNAVALEATKQGYILRYYYSVDDFMVSGTSRTNTEVASVIVLGRPDPDALALLRRNYRNLVYSGLNVLSEEIDQVVCSGYEAARLGMQHLMSFGHTKICYLGETVSEQRYQGYCDTMAKFGLPDAERYVIETPFTPAGAYSAVNDYLKQNKDFTAILCANDISAPGVLKALKEHKIKVPRDVSLIGVNDMESVRYLDPMLTAISVPTEEMGKMVAKLLIDRIVGGHRIATKIEIPCSLVRRDSCGPVKKASKAP